MTLQWTVVAVFLYAEIAFLCLLILPWIRPWMWQKLFKSRLAKMIESYANVYVYVGAGVLGLFFLDAIREVYKYQAADDNAEHIAHSVQSDALIHMKLFRAQRNLYISGFALFLFLVIRRMINLINTEAHLQASAEASLKQAKNAGEAAKRLLEQQGDSGDAKTVVKQEETIVELQNSVNALTKELEAARADKSAMEAQARNLQQEYDRLGEQLRKAETAGGAGGGGDKKGD